MALDLSQVKEITIPQGNVVQIEDSSSNVIWKSSSGFGYTIVKIDETVSDPYNRVTYPASVTINSKLYKNCIPQSGFTEARGTSLNSWVGHKLIEGIQPVAMDSNGNWITSGYSLTDSTAWSSSYDWFTEFPFRWMAWYKTGNDVYIIFSDDENNPDSNIFQDYAFLNNSNQRVPNFHLGCFDGTMESVYYQGANLSILYSKRSNSTPTASKSITDFIYYANRKNYRTGLTDFDIITYYQVMYIIGLFVTMYKTTDCQGYSNSSYGLGKGYVGGSAVQSIVGLLFDNNYGMYGDRSGTTSKVSFFWIHDIWGNIFNLIGGAKTNTNNVLLTQTGKISSVTDSDFNINTGVSSSVNGYCTSIAGGQNTGAFPISTSGGSGTKYYSDDCYVNYNRFPRWGGYYQSGNDAGLFLLSFYVNSGEYNPVFGSRLSYKGGRIV